MLSSNVSYVDLFLYALLTKMLLYRVQWNMFNSIVLLVFWADSCTETLTSD